MEKEAEKELRKEMQRVRVLMDEEVGDDDEVGIIENAMQILQALKELKLNQNDQGFRALKNIGIPEPLPQFVCPISGMLMKDPVTVDSGQTYDAESIQKWLNEGNKTCPKTGEDLSHVVPVQNRLLKTIIGEWCKSNQNSWFQEMEQVSSSEQKTLYDARDLHCPLSGKLMTNPIVIVSGQTFDEGSIQKWLKTGHTRCPLTREHISHRNFIKNHLIKKMIEPSSGGAGDEETEANATEQHLVDIIMHLPSSTLPEQQAAMKELRLLTTRFPSFRSFFHQTEGAVRQLLTPVMIQTYLFDIELCKDAVATILNITTEFGNKKKLMEEAPSAIRLLIKALVGVNIIARGVAASALWELSYIYSSKLVIAQSGALQPLIKLMKERHPLASREAALAVTSLCKADVNKNGAISEGVNKAALDMLMNDRQLFDAGLEILALLSKHSVALREMEKRGVVPRLFSILGEMRSRREEQNCIVILNKLAGRGKSRLREIECAPNAVEIITNVKTNGTRKARKKAGKLLDKIKGKKVDKKIETRK